jgi:uncharacterized membrane protein
MVSHYALDPIEAMPSSGIAIRTITTSDLWQALKAGYADFNARPTIGTFLFLVYPLFALLLTLFLVGNDLLYLAFPMVAGLTLLGPAVSVALFEMSRRREQGLDTTWREAFGFVHSARFAPILGLTVVMTLLYVAWLMLAEALYFGTIGANPPVTVAEFVERLVTTRPGLALILYGNLVGLLFAFTALATSVVAFPLLLDKPVSVLTAVGASLRAVSANLAVMLVWGLVVVAFLLVGAAMFLIGLAVVLPVLGHATWHLYRRLVVD